ncbi:MAG: hypothetical protein EB084_18790, partial [Proteobacteria bacterium]|nr:hypothetical protein [Pseudomonadota bacterium]
VHHDTVGDNEAELRGRGRTLRVHHDTVGDNEAELHKRGHTLRVRHDTVEETLHNARQKNLRRPLAVPPGYLTWGHWRQA